MKTTFRHFMWTVLLCLCIACVAASCSSHDTEPTVPEPTVNVTTYKIAVVLPLSQSEQYKTRVEQTVAWAQENLANAQKKLAAAGDTAAVAFDIEWYDEEKENMLQLSAKLAQRQDIMLIIGPENNDNVNTMAQACQNNGKPLVVPSASSEDVIRRYAVKFTGDRGTTPFLWSLCESDVALSNVLVSQAYTANDKTIALLSPDDTYGKTFYDWVPYMAVNMGVQLLIDNNIQYTKDNLVEKTRQALQSGADCLICAAETPDEVKTILETRKETPGTVRRILFTDAALSASFASLDDQLKEGVEGVAHYANPATGFNNEYYDRFNRYPAAFESHVYDAMLLSAVAAYVKKHYPADNKTGINETIRQITSTGDTPCTAWNEDGMYKLLTTLKDGGNAKITGASGLLRFDKDSYTSIVESTYVYWHIFNGSFKDIDFVTISGDGDTTGAMASWNWTAQNVPELEDADAPVQFKSLKDKWAVLVQGSSGWENYRHQADVLNVYWMLKRNGWPDDHIILIVSDDIARNERNKFPGEVRTMTSGADLYGTALIDYSTDTLTTADLKNIFLGNKSAHLPTVLDATTDQSNVLVFWSGHGLAESADKPNCFTWRNKTTFFTDTELNQLLTGMYEAQHYRKILMLMEPCHSQAMAMAADHMPGVLAIASAYANENSFADYHSPEMDIWMSDRFSNNIVTTLSEKPTQTYKELYEYLYRHTIGSHVCIANAGFFGNLFRDSPAEFFVYN